MYLANLTQNSIHWMRSTEDALVQINKINILLTNKKVQTSIPLVHSYYDKFQENVMQRLLWLLGICLPKSITHNVSIPSAFLKINSSTNPHSNLQELCNKVNDARIFTFVTLFFRRILVYTINNAADDVYATIETQENTGFSGFFKRIFQKNNQYYNKAICIHLGQLKADSSIIKKMIEDQFSTMPLKPKIITKGKNKDGQEIILAFDYRSLATLLDLNALLKMEPHLESDVISKLCKGRGQVFNTYKKHLKNRNFIIFILSLTAFIIFIGITLGGVAAVVLGLIAVIAVPTNYLMLTILIIGAVIGSCIVLALWYNFDYIVKKITNLADWMISIFGAKQIMPQLTKDAENMLNALENACPYLIDLERIVNKLKLPYNANTDNNLALNLKVLELKHMHLPQSTTRTTNNFLHILNLDLSNENNQVYVCNFLRNLMSHLVGRLELIADEEKLLIFAKQQQNLNKGLNNDWGHLTDLKRHNLNTTQKNKNNPITQGNIVPMPIEKKDLLSRACNILSKEIAELMHIWTLIHASPINQRQFNTYMSNLEKFNDFNQINSALQRLVLRFLTISNANEIKTSKVEPRLEAPINQPLIVAPCIEEPTIPLLQT